MTTSAAPSPGDMTRLRTPMATVGRPWPSTPLTKPASTKANAATAMMKLESGMAAYNASPRISRGCEAAGATPSRSTARRSGPIRSIR